MSNDRVEGEDRQLRCPYCLRSHSLDNAMLSWCLGRHEDDESRAAKGFVEAQAVVEAFAADGGYGHTVR